MPSAGTPRQFRDVTGRMELFARLFGEQIGINEPEKLPTTTSVIAVVGAHLPPAGHASDEAPVFEAAAFIGEWLRKRAGASWVADGPLEPHLQLVDGSRAIVYLLPLVQVVRTASTAGYDGLPEMLDRVIADVTTPAVPGSLSELRVEPAEERDAVVDWTRRHLAPDKATRAALWRRCSVCARIDERLLTLPRPGDDWEEEAATAANILSAHPFECPCGGPAGSVTRFLMLRHHQGARRLGDIYVGSTHTRVGCWTLDGERIEPFDAIGLTVDEVYGQG